MPWCVTDGQGEMGSGDQTPTRQISSSDICMIKVSRVQGYLPILNAWPLWRNDWKLIYSWTFFSLFIPTPPGNDVSNKADEISISFSLPVLCLGHHGREFSSGYLWGCKHLIDWLLNDLRSVKATLCLSTEHILPTTTVCIEPHDSQGAFAYNCFVDDDDDNDSDG